MKEIWKDITGYEGVYQVSSESRVKSLARTIPYRDGRNRPVKEMILNDSVDSIGYPVVALWANNRSRAYRVHRLVMTAFVPNPNNKRCVNHKNGIKSDNRLENLEWVTYKENNQHAWVNGMNEGIRKATGKRASKVVIDTASGKEYPSAKIAAKEMGMNYSTFLGWLNDDNRNETNLKFKQ